MVFVILISQCNKLIKKKQKKKKAHDSKNSGSKVREKGGRSEKIKANIIDNVQIIKQFRAFTVQTFC